MKEPWQHRLDTAIDQRFEQMVAVRRHLHAHPEPSGEELQTSLYLYSLLGEEGFRVEMGPEGRGVVAREPGETGGNSCIALRADIDALHIHDQKEVPYRSQCDGRMHACGHDAHTATVLGAILGLRDAAAASALPCPVTWKAIFQPAEETCKGALAMIDGGALEGVDAILATHVDPTRQVGHVGLRSGVLTANCDAMRLTITGRGGHAARPHETVDSIAIAAQLISSLYQFVPRATDSQDAVVVTIGQILGGDNPNVIPERVQLNGTLRTLDRDVQQRAIDHICQLARGMAEASASEIDVRFGRGVGSVNNDPKLTDLLRQAAVGVVSEQGVDKIPRPSMGSEDFAFYLDHVPGAMFRLGCASEEVGGASLHTPMFDVDERALKLGAKILARAAVMWSQQAESEHEVREDQVGNRMSDRRRPLPSRPEI